MDTNSRKLNERGGAIILIWGSGGWAAERVRSAGGGRYAPAVGQDV